MKREEIIAGLKGPGMDTRYWVRLMEVERVEIDETGVHVQGKALPSEDPIDARVLHLAWGTGGSYWPIKPGDWMIALVPEGDPDLQVYALGPVYMGGRSLPEHAQGGPQELYIAGDDVRIEADTRVEGSDGAKAEVVGNGVSILAGDVTIEGQTVTVKDGIILIQGASITLQGPVSATAGMAVAGGMTVSGGLGVTTLGGQTTSMSKLIEAWGAGVPATGTDLTTRITEIEQTLSTLTSGSYIPKGIKSIVEET